MFWFGLILVIAGTFLGTMVFSLSPHRPSWDRQGLSGTYGVCFGLVVWGAYVLYPVST